MSSTSIPYRWKIFDLCLIVFLCLVAVLIEVPAFFGFLKPEEESLATWFQRSGAITSIGAYFAQYRIGVFLESIRGTSFGESFKLFQAFKKHHDLVSYAVLVVGVWGAVVWGYGDLMIQY